mmetsp:Transcript_9653/g.29842  ORF Transcript_9653/g.29842 Transcript_9653/m.29842 type:complete len:208 (+) Transcript_9653:68-691(+)|eukprot:CAMPEP_0174831448 /NCGR_PEP_ID=MMETSP1114-20130205/3094_1 /TAXON_ID=312471 /ORGANISM="Neobodo designis, Strain CCAP 1951/1" /LENGTH=207 /DNA_ID=CAMNT_0016065271 /DNA_START=63 /DNA_END=686 /DNA_ORIENTATION=-
MGCGASSHQAQVPPSPSRGPSYHRSPPDAFEASSAHGALSMVRTSSASPSELEAFKAFSTASRCSENGVEAEEPSTLSLTVRTTTIALRARFQHGIDSNPFQFPAARELQSVVSRSKRLVRVWLSEMDLCRSRSPKTLDGRPAVFTSASPSGSFVPTTDDDSDSTTAASDADAAPSVISVGAAALVGCRPCTGSPKSFTDAADRAPT